VNDLGRAREFYGWLMPRLGYPGVQHWDGGSGWYGDGGSFWIKAAAGPGTFSKDRVGLCEIAFRAESRGDVDALAGELAARRARASSIRPASTTTRRDTTPCSSPTPTASSSSWCTSRAEPSPPSREAWVRRRTTAVRTVPVLEAVVAELPGERERVVTPPSDAP